MRRITATEDERSIRLIFDDDLDRCRTGCTCTDCELIPAAFVGYEIRGLLYSSLETLPAWARPRAIELIRDRAAEDIAEDIAQAIAYARAHRGRPRQSTCSRGHSLRSARVGSDGRRHCRRCEALVRTNARKTAGQSTRFGREIERVG